MQLCMGGGSLEFETGTWTPTNDTTGGVTVSSRKTIAEFSRAHTRAPDIVIVVDAGSDTPQASSMLGYIASNNALWANAGWNGIAVMLTSYYVDSSADKKTSTGQVSTFSDIADATAIYTKTPSSGIWWRKDRSYAWIAIWI